MAGTAAGDRNRRRGRRRRSSDRARPGAERGGGDSMIGSSVSASRERVGVGDVAAAAQLACLLEASAPKPGNVSPGRHFEDLRYEDFLASAAAIGAPLGA